MRSPSRKPRAGLLNSTKVALPSRGQRPRSTCASWSHRLLVDALQEQQVGTTWVEGQQELDQDLDAGRCPLGHELGKALMPQGGLPLRAPRTKPHGLPPYLTGPVRAPCQTGRSLSCSRCRSAACGSGVRAQAAQAAAGAAAASSPRAGSWSWASSAPVSGATSTGARRRCRLRRMAWFCRWMGSSRSARQRPTGGPGARSRRHLCHIVPLCFVSGQRPVPSLAWPPAGRQPVSRSTRRPARRRARNGANRMADGPRTLRYACAPTRKTRGVSCICRAAARKAVRDTRHIAGRQAGRDMQHMSHGGSTVHARHPVSVAPAVDRARAIPGSGDEPMGWCCVGPRRIQARCRVHAGRLPLPAHGRAACGHLGQTQRRDRPARPLGVGGGNDALVDERAQMDREDHAIAISPEPNFKLDDRVLSCR